MHSITDDQWFAANLSPEKNLFGIPLPSLPSEDMQVLFTGKHGKANLQEAFDFYKFVLQHLPPENIGQFRLLDFGGGWGRIMRFFLREASAERLILVDCLTAAIECAQSLNPPFRVVQTDVNPPLPFNKEITDCCIAYSVFSHLSETSCISWLQHLSELIVSGGSLIFTTRGQMQIEVLRHLHRQTDRSIHNLGRHAYKLLKKLPHPDEIALQYEDGNFIFYPTGGVGELTEDFYGEAWVPEKWMEERYRGLGFKRCQFFAEFSTIEQCVFVLTKE
jgi:hypothetical protein